MSKTTSSSTALVPAHVSGRGDINRIFARFVIVIPIRRIARWLCVAGLIGGAAVAGYWLSGAPAPTDVLHGPGDSGADGAVPSFVELPDMIVDLHPDSRSRYLKIGLTLAVPTGQRARIAALEPEFSAAAAEFLHQIDDQDIAGTAGLSRLRAELLRRFRLLAGDDAAITNVLLRNILTQ